MAIYLFVVDMVESNERFFFKTEIWSKSIGKAIVMCDQFALRKTVEL